MSRNVIALMSFCPKCGTQLASDAAFCPGCGNTLASATSIGLPPRLAPTQIPCTTALSIAGYRIVRELGIIRGLTVRTRGVGGRSQAGISGIVGGEVDASIDMCEETRSEALQP